MADILHINLRADGMLILMFTTHSALVAKHAPAVEAVKPLFGAEKKHDLAS